MTPSAESFARLDAEQFQECFVEWVQAVSDVTRGQLVAIDGKTVRRSHDRSIGKGAIHMVSAWVSANRLVLGPTKVDERSNEITAIPAILRRMALNMLKSETTSKGGITSARELGGITNTYSRCSLNKMRLPCYEAPYGESRLR